MPLIVEDGTMPDGANSYVSLDTADAYLVPRGLWPETEIKEEPQEPENGEVVETRTYQTEPEGFCGGMKIVPDFLVDGNQTNEIADVDGFLRNNEQTETEDSEETQPELPDTSKPDDNPEIAKKETALMRAFDYLDTLKWKGQRVDWQRQVAWPRKNVPVPGCNPYSPEYIADDIIPDAVKKAQMELAALIYNGVDMFKPLERGGQYQSQSDSFSKSVDVLSKSESHSVAYASNAPKDTWLPSVYPLLRDFLDEVPGETNGFTVHSVLRG